MEKVKYIKDIRIIREDEEPRMMAVKARGVAELRHLLTPVLVSASDPGSPTSDGIYEMDFVLGDSGNQLTEVELEVDVVFKFRNLPAWVKGIRVNAKENSDIELIL